MQQNGVQKPNLLDHLVGTGEQLIRYCQPERLGSCQIDDEIEFGGLLRLKTTLTIWPSSLLKNRKN